MAGCGGSPCCHVAWPGGTLTCTRTPCWAAERAGCPPLQGPWNQSTHLCAYIKVCLYEGGPSPTPIPALSSPLTLQLPPQLRDEFRQAQQHHMCMYTHVYVCICIHTHTPTPPSAHLTCSTRPFVSRISQWRRRSCTASAPSFTMRIRYAKKK